MDWRQLMNSAIHKCRWGQQHLVALKGRADAYCSECLSLEGGQDLEHGSARLRIKADVPIEIALNLGDAVHNLRSALDHVACSLRRHSKPNATLTGVGFPYPEVGSAVTDEAIADKIGKLDVPTSFVFKALTGRHSRALHVLQAVSNQDKHRGLVIAVPHPQTHQVVIADGKFVGFQAVTEDFDGREFSVLTDGDIIQVNKAVRLELALILQKEKQMVRLAEMDGLLAAVVEIIDSLSAKLLA